MNLLHTSDWHLGRTLYGKKRDDEFRAFLDWLLITLEQETIDVLIVAGDIFDTSAPSHQAQTMYYQFLFQVAQTHCRHVVIIAGNHDSPSFINAPKAILSALDVHVIGQACLDPADEVIELRDAQGHTELIVCAVPYLRDRDIRTVEAGESVDDKAQKLIQGTQQHYAIVATIAEQKQAALAKPVPIVATGHLFTAGGKVQSDDGVRDLYVGSIAHFSAGLFPDSFDYIALGHLHVPQTVAGSKTIRYSGSPIAMGFGEAKQQKSVCKVSFTSTTTTPMVSLLPIPTFQPLQRIEGNWIKIQQQLYALIDQSIEIWIEINYVGNELLPDLCERIETLTANSSLVVLRIKNQPLVQKTLTPTTPQERLDELSEMDVFLRCLSEHDVATEQHAELIDAYQTILQSVHESPST